MEEVQFVKMNPNKNATIIVLNEFPREDYVKISEKLMKLESVYAEQVGFVEKATDSEASCRLQMMGGEFCANAAVSLCSYLAYEEALQPGQKSQCQLEVSGSETLIKGETLRLDQGYRTKITMPLPLKVKDGTLKFKGEDVEFGIVKYLGICQLIVHVEHHTEQSKLLAHHMLHHEIQDEFDTKGVTLFSNNGQRISPLIYVEKTNTEIWENSCGIASASLAIYKSFKLGKDITLQIGQPSGDYICAHATNINGVIQRVTIEENVFLSAIGTAFV